MRGSSVVFFKAVPSAILIFIVAAAWPCEACGPSYETIHFGGAEDYLRGEILESFYYQLEYPDGNYFERWHMARTEGTGLYQQATKKEKEGDYQSALALYRKALKLVNGFFRDYGMINSMYDRIELLQSDAIKCDPKNLVRYLRDRDIFDGIGQIPVDKFAPENQEFLTKLQQLTTELEELQKTASLLSDNATFLLGALHYRLYNYNLALDYFNEVVSKYPGSEKRDASLFMKAKCLYWLEKKADPYELKESQGAFEQYLAEYPDGNYLPEVICWLGGIACRNTEWGKSLNYFWKILDDKNMHSMFEMTVESLRFFYRRFRDVDWLYGTIFSRPKHATAFIYHNVTDSYGRATERFAEKVAPYLDRIPVEELPRSTIRKLAQAFYCMRDYQRVIQITNPNLRREKEEDPALLEIRCLTYIEQGEDNNAVETFEKLSEKFPDYPHLKELSPRIGAIYERKGNCIKALKFYLDSDFTLDVAYLVDVIMTVEEIKRFMEEYPDHQSLVTVKEALGIRLIRMDKLNEAARYLPPVRDRKKHLEKLLALMKDLQSADEKSKPRILYSIGAHYYHNGIPLLYNGTIWEQVKSCYLEGHYEYTKKAEDKDLISANLRDCNKYMKALPYFLQIARDYPSSSEAPKALYSAACCYFHSRGFNYYWREQDRQENFFKKGHALMEELYGKYPDHGLAPSARKWAGASY